MQEQGNNGRVISPQAHVAVETCIQFLVLALITYECLSISKAFITKIFPSFGGYLAVIEIGGNALLPEIALCFTNRFNSILDAAAQESLVFRRLVY